MPGRRWLRPIADVVAEMGLDWDTIEPYGREIVKVPLGAIPEATGDAKLVVVTAITPTPAGEGKTTTCIGLTDALARLGKRALVTIRQPSLGPLFGRKGGGTGGGRATVHPATDINVHFTDDFLAIGSAHNFLAAMADNAARSGEIAGFTAEGITWRRVTDAEDRALRRVITGVGGRADGPLRETGFDILAASEIMAILALATDYVDLRRRLSDVVVGWTAERTPVTAGELQCVGAMMVLLKDALKPNLAQTVEGQPALIHTGPFGNIAHGCSSIIADRLALACGEYVVTEAGFGADLGFEKFMDIKVRQGGPEPAAVVVVATVRGLKWHGGVDEDALAEPNPAAVAEGAANLRHAVRVVARYGLQPVVAINRFADDTADEIAVVQRAAVEAGASAAVVTDGFAEGGAGAVELAEAVVAAAEQPSTARLLYGRRRLHHRESGDARPRGLRRRPGRVGASHPHHRAAVRAERLALPDLRGEDPPLHLRQPDAAGSAGRAHLSCERAAHRRRGAAGDRARRQHRDAAGPAVAAERARHRPRRR